MLSTLEEISYYRKNHIQASLIIDTNILCLLLVGSYDLEYLNGCPLFTENGTNYSKEHYNLMDKILRLFVNKIALTPHVVSEINMLSHKIKPKDKREAYFMTIIKRLSSFKEFDVPLKVLLQNGSIIQFGFTDMSLVEAAEKQQSVILTDEFNLYRQFKENVPIIYFKQLVATELHKIKI